MTSRYVIIEKRGGPEVLELQEEPIPTAGKGEVVVRNKAIGFNFLDTYIRRGIYPSPLPTRFGAEAAGVVHAVGPDVDGIQVGDRVAWNGFGAYAEYTKVVASSVAKLPDAISFETAAASMLKALTVQMLIEKVYAPKKDEIVLFHAGAGGVGLLFLQWARNIGVKVITTVSSDEKAEIARANGAWATLKYSEDVPARVKELTGGKGVPVVYDAVGKDTFEQSLDSLAPKGLFVSFGNASGNIPDFSIKLLHQKGSIFATFPGLYHYLDDFVLQLDEIFKLIEDGTLKVNINQTYKLDDVAQLHKDAEARLTTGSTVIIP